MATFFAVRRFGELAFGFFPFLATSGTSLSPPLWRRDSNHTIAFLSKARSPRVVTQVTAGGVSIEIRPLVRTRGARWRLGLADGEPAYDEFEQRLAVGPAITVPTITLEGDANGAPHPEPAAYAQKFTGKYVHRTIDGGVGHNLPQEAPQSFAQAILDVEKL